jgi:hypothetical protein
MEFYQTKKIYIAKETIDRVKRQSAEWKKTLENYSFYRD